MEVSTERPSRRCFGAESRICAGCRHRKRLPGGRCRVGEIDGDRGDRAVFLQESWRPECLTPCAPHGKCISGIPVKPEFRITCPTKVAVLLRAPRYIEFQRSTISTRIRILAVGACVSGD